MNKKKNVLLLNPWIFDFTAYDFWMRPIGLLSVAAMIRQSSDHRLHLIDCLDRFHPDLPVDTGIKADGRGEFFKVEVLKPDVLHAIPRKFSRYGYPIQLFKDELAKAPRPDVVLITCLMTYWYPGVQLAVELIREQLGSVPVILGGVYPTLLPDHARQHSGADMVITGPGEAEILKVLNDIFGGSSSAADVGHDHEAFSHSAFDLLPNKDVLPLLTSRGCPFTCSYCASQLLYDGFKRRSVQSVVSEIERDVQEYGAQNIAFYDDSLLLDKENHIIPILEHIAEKKMPVSFHTPNGLHVKEIDPVMADMMKKARVESVYLSQESFSSEILRSSSSKVEPGDLEKALNNLEKAGYARNEVKVYLLTGLPEQDKRSVEEDILRVLELGAKPYLAFFSPVPGTEEWKKLLDIGKLKNTDDPLLQNKNIFPYKWGRIDPDDLNDLKILAQKT